VTYEDPGFVARQYRDASNLGARVALHRRFSTNEQPWQRWVFDQFELPPAGRILELGCGPGNLWVENLDRVPDGWSVMLTDASPGMVTEAEDRLGSNSRFAFRVVDAQEIPFEGQSFDAMIANHMLYHVPDRARVFSEIVRILRSGGRLYAATNGEGHMQEVGRMFRVMDPSHPAGSFFRDPPGFSLENGAEQLSPWFPEVSLRRYQDALLVTDAKPLTDYLLSGTAADAAARGLAADEFRRKTAEITGLVKQELASRGEIRITKDTGLFVDRK
jgi:SAM-dependent methyltransferase